MRRASSLDFCVPSCWSFYVQVCSDLNNIHHNSDITEFGVNRQVRQGVAHPRKQKIPTQTMSVDIVTAMTATTPMVTTIQSTKHIGANMHQLQTAIIIMINITQIAPLVKH